MKNEDEQQLQDLDTWDDSRSLAKPPLDDFELVRSAAAGDMGAFEEIYKRYRLRAYAISLRMLRDPSRAQDSTQDAFVQLYRKIGTFRGEAAFSTWFHRLVVNQALMFMRQRYLKRERQSPEYSSYDPNEPTVKRDNLVDSIALKRAIRKLPVGYRKVFILHDVDGYEHAEIGKILGCAEGTSKSQLHKARATLRKLMGRRFLPPVLYKGGK